MEIKIPAPQWETEATCPGCKAVLKVNADDIEVDRFVDNSQGEYWFAGHPGHEKTFVTCITPYCGKYIFLEVPAWVRNKAVGKSDS